MRHRSGIQAMCLLAALSGVAAAQGTSPIDTLKPGEWYRAPNSRLASVAPPGMTANVIDPWSGGAYDSQRDRLIVWGGGHGDYSGNEVYVFELATMAWKRLNNPSNPPGMDTPYAPDGNPTSRHTYNYLQYLPSPVDRFCTFGGSAFYPSAISGTGNVDCFNFDTLKWEPRKFAGVAQPSYGSTAYDPTTKHVWYQGWGQNGALAELDPATNTWTARGGFGGWFTYYQTIEIDAKRRKLVSVGAGESWVWNISAAGAIPPVKLVTTGDNWINGAHSPGLAYDPVAERIVAWNGGADVVTLNLDTSVWTRVGPAATNTVIPTAANRQGTYGRFRYIPSKNAYIVVNGIHEDVYLYKLSAGGGTPPPPPPPPPQPVPQPPGSTPGKSSGGGSDRCGCGSVSLGSGELWMMGLAALLLFRSAL